MKRPRSGKPNVLARRRRRLCDAAAHRRRHRKWQLAHRYQPRRVFHDGSRNVAHFPSPPQIDLSDNYDEAVQFLMQFRNWSESCRRRQRFYVDLRPLRTITPAGALMLAAELDRWGRIHGRKARAYDAEAWDPSVRATLWHMGFFGLFESKSKEANFGADESDLKMIFLPLYGGEDTNGRPFLNLRDMIERHTGKLRNRLSIYQGVSEAITNVRQHAYRERSGLKRWWMSASFDKERSALTIMVLDHGRGIPSTLGRRGAKESIRQYLKSLGPIINDDGKMIEAAMQLGRSSVEEDYRGHGLSRDIRQIVNTFSGRARLRIFSNKGQYVFTRDGSGRTSVQTTTKKYSLQGTFVEWRFELVPHNVGAGDVH